MTTLYFIPPDNINGNIATLPESEAHHAVQVVRHRAGDVIYAVDGVGGWYKLSLTRVGKRLAEGTVIEQRQNVGEPEYRLTIGMALLKNQKRFDVFVEKAAELGVSRIVPLITARTEKKTLKETRVEKILIAAMKQCGRSRLIQLDEATTLDTLVQGNKDAVRMCCHEKVEAGNLLYEQLEVHDKSRDLLICIGPEGGFTDTEVDMMSASGCSVVSLGPRRLRAETAAIAASTGVMLHYSR